MKPVGEIDEFHLLLKEEQTAAYSVEIWKRFRKWGGIPTGITCFSPVFQWETKDIVSTQNLIIQISHPLTLHLSMEKRLEC